MLQSSRRRLCHAQHQPSLQYPFGSLLASGQHTCPVSAPSIDGQGTGLSCLLRLSATCLSTTSSQLQRHHGQHQGFCWNLEYVKTLSVTCKRSMAHEDSPGASCRAVPNALVAQALLNFQQSAKRAAASGSDHLQQIVALLCQATKPVCQGASALGVIHACAMCICPEWLFGYFHVYLSFLQAWISPSIFSCF